jgi:hypothetical protein
MPSSVSNIFAAASLEPVEVVRWGERLAESRPGVYAVALTHEPKSTSESRPKAPLSRSGLVGWLKVRPELRLDGERPSVPVLAKRLGAFWLPDEVVLYIGSTRRPLCRRVDEFYNTPLGARRPHAGGHFLKTLDDLSDLWVHVAPAGDPRGAEDSMLRQFCSRVSEASRESLFDAVHPFPFANIEWPQGTRKRHGLTGTKEAR